MHENFHGGRAPRIIMAVIMGIFAAAMFSLITGVFVMLLWNWLMPMIFDLGTITFWQAFGLSLLAKLMLGGFGKHFSGGPGGRRWHDKRWREYAKHPGRCGDWRFDDVYEQWWEKEGSESFENYLKNQKEKEQDKQDKE